MHRFSHAAEAVFVVLVALEEIEPRPAFGDGVLDQLGQQHPAGAEVRAGRVS